MLVWLVVGTSPISVIRRPSAICWGTFSWPQLEVSIDGGTTKWMVCSVYKSMNWGTRIRGNLHLWNVQSASSMSNKQLTAWFCFSGPIFLPSTNHVLCPATRGKPLLSESGGVGEAVNTPVLGQHQETVYERFNILIDLTIELNYYNLTEETFRNSDNICKTVSKHLRTRNVQRLQCPITLHRT